MGEIEIAIDFSQKALTLNSEQYKAVTRHPRANQRILAAAGSGKTTTLTGRIAWLLEKENVPAESIILLTFSRNAAQQMRVRLEEFVGKQDIYCGTFHGIAKQLLREYQPKLLKRLYFIDELVTMGLQWLEAPEGQQWVQNLKYVFVDEFQDINNTQWKFLKALIRQGARLIIVGDDAQNIYTWRGSNVKYILDLHKEIPDLVDDQLRSNYRSSASIVAAANGVLRNIPSLPWKGTMIAKRPAGPRPEVHFFWRACDETAWVLKQMRIIQKEHPTWRFCVLSRTNSDLFRIEEVLQAQALPYRLREVFDESDELSEKHTLDLVTLHASKGLEWDCVFLIGCNDDSFPAKKSNEEIICERRLFYVGVTRAKQMLYLTYTKKERALSRFIREIPCTRLLYTGLARYTLSDVDRAEGKSRLIDILSALDGNQLNVLRKRNVFDPIEKEVWKTEQLFPAGIWKVPEWASKYDKGGDFYRFLRLWVYRHIWMSLSNEEPFHEPALERLLFTLRVYAEEREFFEQWRSEVFEMLHTWFQSQQGETPAIEFHVVKEWADKKNLFWSVQDLVKATTLMAKLRGQLRPLRFEPYDIHDFTIGYARYMVPTEWRLDTLRSWRRINDKKLGWRDVLVDLWRLGALSLCAEGRNVALYRVIEMSQFLLQPDILEFLEQLENSLGPWLTKRTENLQFGIMLENQDIFTEQLDVVIDGTFWKICVEHQMDALQILELAVRASLARKEGIELKRVGWIHPLDGTVVSMELTEVWDTSVNMILENQ